ncbi:uncharacterized protein E0L32_009771 [Thyridium curvatum]|uniref:dihydroorotase n=1 Tax=Thyridium curvatum TaxID=1093900 RepID=A0A507AV84_9PEZI|nr:uncharacterized protein E0L32_009771 [Thyridium curvatum]TPX08831.1 hypothetical protein E0L32_009771 [Thyridium curvatum]
MPLKDSYTVPAAADMHVHLRDGAMAELVTPTIRPAGIDTVFVMPNLSPRPVVSVQEALDYKRRLQAIDPSVDYLMSLYLHKSITPEVIREAKRAGIAGVKAYPRGVTTNSEWGVVSFDEFADVLAAMEREGVVLNIHGEAPTSIADGVDLMNAESRFLPVLKGLSTKYPKLKIVLEHTTSADAVEAVKACDNVVATITAHHLSLLQDQWASDAHCFCKPSAKTPEDRKALLNAVVNSNGKFFLGTDSARKHPDFPILLSPTGFISSCLETNHARNVTAHNISAKKVEGSPAAGVFTQPYALGYVLSALEEGIERGDIKEEQVTEELLSGFFSNWAREFYGLEPAKQKVLLKKNGQKVAESLKSAEVEVVPYRAGQSTWSVEWQ